VQRAAEAAAGPFECAAHVQDGDQAVAAHNGQVSETRDRERCQRLAAGPFLRDSPRAQPAKVVREVAAVLEAQRSADVPGRELPSAAQVGDPFTGGDADGQLRGVRAGWRGQVGRTRPGALAGPMCE